MRVPGILPTTSDVTVAYEGLISQASNSDYKRPTMGHILLIRYTSELRGNRYALGVFRSCKSLKTGRLDLQILVVLVDPATPF